MNITQEAPTGRIRFLRKKDGRAILQQQWERAVVQAPRSAEEMARQQFFTAGASEVWWQDVPMVSAE